MNKISITLKGRTVYWEIEEANATVLLQMLVQSLGPAKEDEVVK